MSIKVRIGKLELPILLKEMEQEIINQGFQWLQIKNPHLLNLVELEIFREHKDPFDRLLVAQSRVESMELFTCDKELSLYRIRYYPRNHLRTRLRKLKNISNRLTPYKSAAYLPSQLPYSASSAQYPIP